MSELEDLRRKKMELYKHQYSSVAQQSNEQQELLQQIQQLELNLKHVMTADAVARYSNVKLAHPEKAVQALVVLAQLVQNGDVRAIDDVQLKNVLAQLTPQKKQTKVNLHGAI